jgi:hypothetical protein
LKKKGVRGNVQDAAEGRCEEIVLIERSTLSDLLWTIVVKEKG